MTFFYLFFVFTLHVITLASASEDWCYEIQVTPGHACKGPKEWKDIGDCGKDQQSPIDIVKKNTHYNEELTPFSFKGYETEVECNLTNNGHSAQLNLSGHGMTISGGGLSTSYIATQLHFHWGSEKTAGSEHSIDGKKYPVELHVVHTKASGRSEPSSSTSESGDIAVLGFFLEESTDENPYYKNITDSLKNIAEEGTRTISKVKLQDLLLDEEALKTFYRYEGSLTTPSCSEVVTWTVFPKTIKLSKEQISQFYTSLHYSTSNLMTENFRPTQKLGDRNVFTSGVDAALSHSTHLLVSMISFYVIFIS